jgi:transcriptional regulator with XRE-family HTH domain
VSDFGKRLKAERVLWGMTQMDLAAETGIAREKISRIENDERKATGEDLQVFARVFQTTVDSLLGPTASIRCRVNQNEPTTKAAIAWFERCVDNSLFIRSLPDLYAPRQD